MTPPQTINSLLTPKLFRELQTRYSQAAGAEAHARDIANAANAGLRRAERLLKSASQELAEAYQGQLSISDAQLRGEPSPIPTGDTGSKEVATHPVNRPEDKTAAETESQAGDAPLHQGPSNEIRDVPASHIYSKHRRAAGR